MRGCPSDFYLCGLKKRALWSMQEDSFINWLILGLLYGEKKAVNE